MRKFLRATITVCFVLAAIASTSTSSTASEIPRITVDQLNGVLGNSDIEILDVRASWDWNKSSKKISGAVRAGTANQAENLDKSKTIVLYCA